MAKDPSSRKGKLVGSYKLENSDSIFKILRYEDFKTKIEEIVDFQSMEVIGSGSIGQVYKCNLYNGKEVAIKVKHPDVERIATHQMYSILVPMFLINLRI